jgi:multidrug efflux system outer membrane protein
MMIMKKLLILILMGAAITFNSCGLYKQYSRPQVNATGLYRDTVSIGDTLAAADTTNFGNLSWREVFTDNSLQQLIDSGLKNNNNLQIAILSVQEAEAQLKAAKLAFFPSFAFAGTGQVGVWDFQKAAQVYSLPIQASWTVDLFGKLTNAKRAQQEIYLRSRAYQQAVRAQVVANIANSYYSLLMLDRQLEITDSTAILTKHTWDIMAAQKNLSPSITEASVQSAKANYYSVLSSAAELKRQIRVAENAISLLIGQAPQTIKRGKIADQNLPENLSVGVPVQLLSNRPDVYSAELALAACYYQKKQAQANFYPTLTLSGSGSWTNSSGMGIVNPGKILASAVASLTQPIFENGRLTAALKVAQAEQQAAFIRWQYAVLSAGSEVNNALALYQTSTQKSQLDQQRVESLTKNVDYAQKLFNLGSSTYLEVITAQQSLLTAQLSKVSDDFNKMQSIVNLYYALGGGR